MKQCFNYQLMEQNTLWTIKSTNNPKFPYHLTISKGGEILLNLYTQDKWPGQKGNIFCLRSPNIKASGGEDEETLECVSVVSYKMYGKKLTVILDRTQKRRCSFLFLTKQYKNKEGEYEQIFWQTQQGLAQHKPKYKLSYHKNDNPTIFIDTGERYAWKFPACETIREKLIIGDYAIKDKFGILAAVERKTLSNLKSEFGNLKKFHQNLSELEDRKNTAVVIEASYNDLLDKTKIAPYSPGFTAKAIAEIQAYHPNLPIIFAGSRKSAVIWVYNFFRIASSKANGNFSEVVRDSVAKYGVNKNANFSEDEVRRVIFTQMPEEFTTSRLKKNLPQIKPEEVRRSLDKLKNENLLTSEKSGRDIIWKKTESVAE